MNQPTFVVGLVFVWSASALGIDPPHPHIRYDLHGQPLPAGAIARFGDLRNKSERIRDFAFSYDGRLIARQRDSGIDLREIATGRDVTPDSLRGQRGVNLIFAPDGRYIIADSTGERCQILNPATGAIEYDLSTAGRHVWHAAVSRDGSAAFTRWYDGRGGAAVTVYKLGDLKKPVGHDVLDGQQGLACLSADGEILYAVTEVGARAFYTATGKELARPPLRHLSHVTGVSLSPDSTTLVAGHVDNLRFYALTSAGIGESVTLPPVDVRGGMAWSVDGRELLVAGRDSILRLDGKTGQLLSQIEIKDSSDRGLLVLSPDGRLAATGGGSESATVWDVKSRKVIYRYPERVSLLGVVCLNDETAMTVDAGLNVEVWDQSDGRPLETHSLATQNPINRAAVQFSLDGQSIAFYDRDSRSVRVCNPRAGQASGITTNLSSDYPTGIGFVPDSSRLLIASGGRVILSDPSRGRLLRELPGGGLAVGVSPDGRLAAVLDRAQVHLIELSSNRIRSTIPVTEVPLNGQDIRFTAGRVRFSGDGSRVAVFGPCFRVWVWQVANSELLYEDRGDRTNLYSDVWPGDLSPDGRWLVYPSADRAGLQLIDLTHPTPGRGTLRIPGHGSRITDLDFASVGTRLVSTAVDGTALVWDLDTLIGQHRPKPVSNPPVETLWSDLAGADAEQAGRAIAGLVQSPNVAVALIGERLEPARKPDPVELARLIQELDSNNFAVRDAAERVLARLREQAVPVLEQALQGPLSAEQRERLERLRLQADGVETHPERIQALRGVEVLERIGSAEARQVLVRLSTGAPQARLTLEAKAAVGRLKNRTAPAR